MSQTQVAMSGDAVPGASSVAKPGVPAPQAQYLTYLDGIRGGAALWVLVAHCMIWGGWYWSYFPNAKIAVDIFMILSGYLMAHQFRVRHEAEATDTRATLTKFYIRRFFRIAPAYYVCLLAVFALGELHLKGFSILREASPAMWGQDQVYDPANTHYTLTNFLLHVTFLFGLLPQYAFSTYLPDWSIGLEMQFYVLFPLLIHAMRKYKYVVPTVVLVGLSYLAMRMNARIPSPVPGSAHFFPEPSFILLKLPLFLTGILAAEAVDIGGRNPRRATGLAILSVLALVLVRASFYTVLVTGTLLYLGRSVTQEGKPASGFSRVLSRLLGNKVTRFLADTSYCVYLFHGFFISACGRFLYTNPQFLALAPPQRVLIVFLVVALGTYALAFALYHLIERPGIEFGRRLIRKKFGARPGAPDPVRAPSTVNQKDGVGGAPVVAGSEAQG